MTTLIAAAAVFLAIHLLIAGTRVRDVISGTIGEGPYLGLFSLASLGVHRLARDRPTARPM